MMGHMSTQRRWSWWRRRRDADFQAEVQAHIDLETERLIADGVDPSDARYAARRAFGNVAAAEERFYESNRWAWLEQIRQDVRYALRTLRRSPTFVATTSLTLGLALGLTTVLFAVFNAYVLRPFAIHDPYRVYHVTWRVEPGDQGSQFSWSEYREILDRTDLFESVAAHRWQFVSTSTGRRLHAAFVSGNYFDTLQPRLRDGRPLASFDAATPGGASVAVLSDQGWARLFNRDPAVLGREVELNGHAIEVVGILRPEFTGMDDMPLDVWLPLTMLPVVSGSDIFGVAQAHELTLFARLRGDVSRAQAEQALAPLTARSVAAQSRPDRVVRPEQVRAELVSRATPNPLTFEVVAILSPIFVAFGLVLAAACANVSSVMLARALGRQREIGVRLSVGASRGRIVRQLLTEAVIISAIAGLTGLAIASAVLSAGPWMFFATLPASLADLMRVVPLGIDWRVFVFTLAVASVATIGAALLPALQGTRLQLTQALRGEVGTRFHSGRLRNTLVVGQVAMSLILLIAAATLARNGLSVAGTDLGFDTRNIYSIQQRGHDAEVFRAAARTLAADPQVEGLAITSTNPLGGALGDIGMTAPDGGTTIQTSYVFASPEYFSLLQIPILRGRTFTPSEAQSEARVAIVSARTAAQFWPGVDPIGRVLRIAPTAADQADALAGYSELVVVGIARDAVIGMLYSGIDASLVYLPTAANGAHAEKILARGREARAQQLEGLRRTLERVHVNRTAFEVLPLAEVKEILLYPLRVASWIGALLGVVAVSLCVSGLYGLLMYVLGQRTREIGIRMALGATSARVVRLMMSQSARVIGIGAAIGLTLTYTALKLLNTAVALRNVSLLDGWAFLAGIALLGAAAVLATFFPARRAARVDPSHALRSDA
jgi:predicted permease